VYLIHAYLRSANDNGPPSDVGALVAQSVQTGELIEHISVHPGEMGLCIMTFFVVSTSMIAAEQTVEAVCRRCIRRHASLSAVTLEHVSAQMLTPYYEKLFAEPTPGRNGTGEESARG
jgi:hypothetical protein